MPGSVSVMIIPSKKMEHIDDDSLFATMIIHLQQQQRRWEGFGIFQIFVSKSQLVHDGRGENWLARGGGRGSPPKEEGGGGLAMGLL